MWEGFDGEWVNDPNVELIILIIKLEVSKKQVIGIEFCNLRLTQKSPLLYPPYPKDRGMLWFYVEAARRPPPAMVLTR